MAAKEVFYITCIIVCMLLGCSHRSRTAIYETSITSAPLGHTDPPPSQLTDCTRDLINTSRYYDGDIETIDKLIKIGAKLDAWDEFGESALHYASTKDENIQLVLLLVIRGADPNIKNKHGWTPLVVAASLGNELTVYTLLSHGASPNVLSADLGSPLHLAIRQKNIRMIEILLHFGGDPLLLDYSGLSPIDLAKALHFEIGIAMLCKK